VVLTEYCGVRDRETDEETDRLIECDKQTRGMNKQKLGAQLFNAMRASTDN